MLLRQHHKIFNKNSYLRIIAIKPRYQSTDGISLQTQNAVVEPFAKISTKSGKISRIRGSCHPSLE